MPLSATSSSLDPTGEQHGMAGRKSKSCPLFISHAQGTSTGIGWLILLSHLHTYSLIAFWPCVLGGAEVWETCVLRWNVVDRQEERVWLVTQTAASGHRHYQGCI